MTDLIERLEKEAERETIMRLAGHGNVLAGTTSTKSYIPALLACAKAVLAAQPVVRSYRITDIADGVESCVSAEDGDAFMAAHDTALKALRALEDGK